MFDWTRCLKLFSFSLSPALVFCISCKRCTCATTCRQADVNLLFFFTQPKKCKNGNIIKRNSWQNCTPHSTALTATQQPIQLLFHEVLGVFKKAGPASARRTTKGRPTPSLSSWHRYHLCGFGHFIFSSLGRWFVVFYPFKKIRPCLPPDWQEELLQSAGARISDVNIIVIVSPNICLNILDI